MTLNRSSAYAESMAVTIEFDPNPEPDVDKYFVWKSDNKTADGTFTKIGEVDHDPDLSVLTFIDPIGEEDDLYRLSAVNTDGVESLTSDAYLPEPMELTRLWDKIRDAGQHGVAGIPIEAQLTNEQAKYKGTIVDRVVRTMTNEDGVWHLDLYPNELLTPPGTKYIIRIGGILRPKKITVPIAPVVSYSSLVTLP